MIRTGLGEALRWTLQNTVDDLEHVFEWFGVSGGKLMDYWCVIKMVDLIRKKYAVFEQPNRKIFVSFLTFKVKIMEVYIGKMIFKDIVFIWTTNSWY